MAHHERKSFSGTVQIPLNNSLRHGHGIASNFIRQTRTGRDREAAALLNFFALSRSIINSSGSLVVLYLTSAIGF